MLSYSHKKKITNTIYAGINKIQREKSPTTFLKSLSFCYSNVDLLIEDLKEKKEILNIQCHPGCAWCCCLPVAARAYEIVVIAEYLKKHWSSFALLQLKNRMKSYLKKTQKSSSQSIQDLISCPFLVQNYCTIYFVRPINCQAHNSCCQHTCHAAFHGKPEIIEFNPMIKEIFEILFKTIKTSFEDMNLDTSHVGLVHGIQRAMEIPQQTEKYLDQHRLFI